MQDIFDNLQVGREFEDIEEKVLKPLCERIAGFHGLIKEIGLSDDKDGKICLIVLRFQSYTIPTLMMRLRFHRDTGITIVSCIERDGEEDGGKVLRCICKDEITAALKRISDIQNELGI